MMRTLLKYILAMFFIAGGVNHFRDQAFYLKMMPPFLPYPEALVAISGVFEIVLGVLLLVPRFQTFAALGLIALLIAVFPANIYMLTHRELWPEVPLVALWVRLPLQLVLIAWAWMFVERDKKPRLRS